MEKERYLKYVKICERAERMKIDTGDRMGAGIYGSRLHTTMSISLRTETSTQQSRTCRNSSDG